MDVGRVHTSVVNKQKQGLCHASKHAPLRRTGALNWLSKRSARPRLVPAQQKLAATTTAGTYLAPHVSDATSLAYQLDAYRGLLATAAVPVMKVGAVGSVGAFCTWQKWLTQEGRHTLAKLVVKLFMPALLFDKLGQHVSFQEAVELWPIAVNVFACHGVGAALAWAYTRLSCAPEHAHKAILASSIVGNVGNLPLILAASLVATQRDPTAQDMVMRCVMVGWFWANLLQAPIGWFLLHKETAAVANKQQDGQAGQLGQSDECVSLAAFNEPITPQDSYGEAAEYTVGRSRVTPVIMTAGMWKESSDWDSNETDSSTYMSGSGVSVTECSSQQAASAAKPALQAPGWLPAFTSPCVLAGVLAMVVASLPVLRDAIFTSDGSLALVGESLDALSQPAVACLMLVLGSNLASAPAPTALRPADAVGGVVTRLVLLPIVGVALLAAADRVGLLEGVDPVAKLVMMLTWATPSALLVHSVASMHQNGDNEIGALMFYEHAAALLTLPLAMAYALNECLA